MFPTHDEASLANEVARTALQASSNATLTIEQIEHNIKLAKEAASKAVSETYASRSSALIPREPGSLAPGHIQTFKVSLLLLFFVLLNVFFLIEKLSPFRQVFDEWLRDRKSAWKLSQQIKSISLNIPKVGMRVNVKFEEGIYGGEITGVKLSKQVAGKQTYRIQIRYDEGDEGDEIENTKYPDDDITLIPSSGGKTTAITAQDNAPNDEQST